MNSGLPSLLDAIFGKKDLASVSLDEVYEVINEFPSFNAAHFLLSKKLKEQNNAAFEKESERTALYFNNAFWLQTLLEEGNHNIQDKIPVQVKESVEEEIYLKETKTPEPFARVEHAVPEALSPEADFILPDFPNPEHISDTVSSFDELILKYNIETIEPFGEPPADADAEPIQEVIEILTVEPVREFIQDGDPEPVQDNPVEADSETQHEYPVDAQAEAVTESRENFRFQEEEKTDKPLPDPDPEQFETVEEIINEYGIFEEVVVRKSDFDQDSFDDPIEKIPAVPETVPVDIPPMENESIIEHQIPDESPENATEQDYEAFDRPIGNTEPEEDPEEFLPLYEISTEPPAAIRYADETEKTEMPAGIQENGIDSQLQHPAEPYKEEQKTVTPFDAKKAESIVFAPYHMIDYFASQGIKLVLEDNPADHFGRQLKSFTDWLKVMKKLPAQPAAEKADEGEADRIRHFAAHSIEDRDILTESMAEVLAKQGMYENAIALYQKLSLIYPPKSAYFASRIEQLKASLP